MPPAPRLRPLTVDDAAEMTRVLADPGLYEFTGGEPPTRDGLERRYRAQAAGRSPDGTQRWINEAVVVDGALVGYVQATVPVDGGPAEIAWVVGAPWQGRGYAAAATGLLLDRLADDGVDSVIAHIHPRHVASQRVAARVGMSVTDVVVDGEVRWHRRNGHTPGREQRHAGPGPDERTPR